MAARFGPLRNHRVGTVRLEPARLRHGRGRAQYERACCLDARQELPVRQAEMKAHHFGAQFLDHVAERGIERRALLMGTGAAGSMPSSR